MKQKRKFKFSWRRILSFGLAILLIAGAIAGVVALTKYINDEKTTVSLDFERGSIDPTTGIQVDSDGALYSELFEAKGLEVNLDFDSKISYQIFWYAQDTKKFNCCTEAATVSGEWYAPANCQARIVITPLWDRLDDDDEEISWYEEWGYEDQLEIRVDKDQKLSESDYTMVNLKNSRFIEHKGKQIQISGGLDNLVDSQSCTTYEFKNVKDANGAYISSLYVDSFLTGAEEYGLHVRMADGSDLYYFSSADTSQPGVFDNEDPLPTFKDPLYIPYGATVFVWAHFGDTGAENTILGLY